MICSSIWPFCLHLLLFVICQKIYVNYQQNYYSQHMERIISCIHHMNINENQILTTTTCQVIKLNISFRASDRRSYLSQTITILINKNILHPFPINMSIYDYQDSLDILYSTARVQYQRWTGNH